MGFMPTLDQACQCSHFFVGAFIVAFCDAVKWGKVTGILLVIGLAIVKEFIWDIRVEEDTWMNGFFDLVFFVAGAITSASLIRFTNWWGGNS